MVLFPLYFTTDSRYTNEVSVYKLYLLESEEPSQPHCVRQIPHSVAGTACAVPERVRFRKILCNPEREEHENDHH